jgi:hypothetical protein
MSEPSYLATRTYISRVSPLAPSSPYEMSPSRASMPDQIELMPYLFELGVRRARYYVPEKLVEATSECHLF